MNWRCEAKQLVRRLILSLANEPIGAWKLEKFNRLVNGHFEIGTEAGNLIVADRLMILPLGWRLKLRNAARARALRAARWAFMGGEMSAIVESKADKKK